MNADSRRAGSGMPKAQPRTAALPSTAPARPSRKAGAGIAGFGSAAALAGAGVAMLASPGSVAPVAGPAHPAQPGVQTATLSASIKSRSATPPQPVLPQSDPANAANVGPLPDPPGNLVNPGAQPNNPSVGFQGNLIFPFSPDSGFGTPSASATAKVALPSMLFGDPAGGSAPFTVTSSQAGNWVNNFLGFLPTPQPLDLGSSVQASRDSGGNLPSFASEPLAGQLSAGMNQNAADAFNALFGPGGPAANIQNITEALLPQPVPLLNLFDPVNAAGGLNMLSSTPVPADSGATFADRFSAVTPSQSDPFSFLSMSGNPPAPAGGGNAAPAATDPAFGAPASGTLGPSSDPAFGAPASGALAPPPGPASDPAPTTFQQGSASDPSVTVATGGGSFEGIPDFGGYYA